MKDLICPHCGAEITRRVCEYCGCDNGVEIIEPEFITHFASDEGFMPAYLYAGINALYPGEIGKLGGVRYVIKKKPST